MYLYINLDYISGQSLVHTIIIDEDLILGDVNCDGIVNSMDSNLLKRAMAAMVIMNGEQEKAADINGDGEINPKDSYILKMIMAGVPIS